MFSVSCLLSLIPKTYSERAKRAPIGKKKNLMTVNILNLTSYSTRVIASCTIIAEIKSMNSKVRFLPSNVSAINIIIIDYGVRIVSQADPGKAAIDVAKEAGRGE